MDFYHRVNTRYVEQDLKNLLDKISSGAGISAGDPEFAAMDRYAREAQRITAEINTGYHAPEDLNRLMSQLIGKDLPEGFRLFPPIYSDFGKNLTLGKNVFINSGCCFQDQGGIIIGDGCQIGHQVVFATINHPLEPKDRHGVEMSSIVLEDNVWIGAHATILKGVTIGHDSVVAAGAVVTRDVPPRTVVAGVPAKPIKTF